MDVSPLIPSLAAKDSGCPSEGKLCALWHPFAQVTCVID